MRSMQAMTGRSTLLFFLFLSIFVPIVPSFSQPSEWPVGHGMRPWRGGETRCLKASDLQLSVDQMKALDLISRTYLEEAQRFQVELFSKRLELREYLTNPTVRMESIQAKSSEIIALQAKIEEKAIEYLVRVRNLLTPEQLRMWCPEEEFPRARRMMERPRPMGPGPWK